jgi:hypothetical protein
MHTIHVNATHESVRAVSLGRVQEACASSKVAFSNNLVTTSLPPSPFPPLLPAPHHYRLGDRTTDATRASHRASPESPVLPRRSTSAASARRASQALAFATTAPRLTMTALAASTAASSRAPSYERATL